MHDTVLLTQALGPEASQLQKAVEENSTESAVTRPLRTAFLILRQYQSKAGPQDVAAQLMMALGGPYVSRIKIDAAASWSPIENDRCKDHLSQWLTEGVGAEPPVYPQNQGQAEAFLRALFEWSGQPTACYENNRSLFKSEGGVDRGCVLVGTRRVGLLWFIGWTE